MMTSVAERVEIPLFDASDPNRWMLRGEKFFDIYRLTEEEKLEVAVVSMEGNALHKRMERLEGMSYDGVSVGQPRNLT